MYKVHFIGFDGQRRSIQVGEGNNLMRASTDNAVPGIDGNCGGLCACGTCHVYVQPPWDKHLHTMRSNEHDTLAIVNERHDTSRLACQITMTAELDGLEVYLPENQC